ncbi:MAG: folylpolyglutamate synthase/dihydrofolate synthase family protein [bacterium]
MTYEQTINYLYSLERFGIQFGLEKIKYLLSLLDRPQHSFKSIHIAGTNGKGSTSSFISSILKEAGFKVGLYTSPHLIDFRERIQVNGVLIPRKRLSKIVAKLMPLIEKTNSRMGHLTYFEISTAIAFEYFKEENIDFACIEVGMGGRLDATNVIKPLISVITSIGFDHTKELGNTLGKIAFEKAGIIKKNGILVCGVNDKEPLNVIKKICRIQNAKLYVINQNFTGTRYAVSLHLNGQEFSYKGIWGRLQRSHVFKISLLGEHQIHNAALALAVIEILGRGVSRTAPAVNINLDNIRAGLKNTKWPGRFEIIRKGGRPFSPAIIIDGAHNPPGACKLSEGLKTFFPGKKINFILGILKDKDIHGIVKEIMPLACKVIITSPHCDRACSPEELVKIAGKYNKDMEAVYPIRKAIKRMREKIRRGRQAAHEVICITGSLYTVGEARKELCENYP